MYSFIQDSQELVQFCCRLAEPTGQTPSPSGPQVATLQTGEEQAVSPRWDAAQMLPVFGTCRPPQRLCKRKALSEPP